MEGDLCHVLQKSLFLRDYWTKSGGVFAEMQTISHCLYQFTISNDIDAESPILFFFGGGGAVGSDYLIDSYVVDLQCLLIMNPVVQYCYWTIF